MPCAQAVLLPLDWLIKPPQISDLALDELLMAVRQSKPVENVIVHSDSNNDGISFYHHYVFC